MKNFKQLKEDLLEDYFTVQYYNGNKNAVDDKFKNFKTKAEADKYAKKGNTLDRVGGEYKAFKVKGRMESVETSEESLEEVFSSAQMKKAIDIAKNSAGDYDKAYAKIEKIKKGLGDEHIIANALKKANESVDIEEGKLDDFDKAYNTWHTATGKLTKAFNAAATDKKALKRYKDGVENIEVAIDRAKMKNESVEMSEESLEEGRADIKKAFLKGPKKTGKDVEKELKKVKKGNKLSIQHSKGLGRSGIGGGDVISVKGDKVTIKPTASNGATVIDAKDITSMTLMKESVDLDEGASLSKKDGYDVQATGKSSVGVQLVLSYKGKAIAQGSKMKGEFVFGFKHNDVHPNARYEPDNMVKKGKDHTHLAFKTAEEVIAFAKKHKIIKEDARDSFMEFRSSLDEAKGFVGEVGNSKSMAVLINDVNERDAQRGTKDAMSKIDAFKKTAKKAWASAKGKKTIPAVKKELKLQGAKQYYAKWPSDSSSFKDDTVEIWFTK